MGELSAYIARAVCRTCRPTYDDRKQRQNGGLCYMHAEANWWVTAIALNTAPNLTCRHMPQDTLVMLIQGSAQISNRFQMLLPRSRLRSRLAHKLRPACTELADVLSAIHKPKSFKSIFFSPMSLRENRQGKSHVTQRTSHRSSYQSSVTSRA